MEGVNSGANFSNIYMSEFLSIKSVLKHVNTEVRRLRDPKWSSLKLGIALPVEIKYCQQT
jgi:hypothetical protein